MSVIELKCKKCLARQCLMKYIKLNKLNKLLTNKQIYNHVQKSKKM